MTARRRWLPALAVAALALAASATSLGNGFAFDDVHVIEHNARVHTLHAWWQLFAQPYWPPAFHGGLYRPLTVLGFALQWAVGGGSPFVFHLVSVLLYAAVAVAVLVLGERLLPRWAACVAAALFAVHPVHVEAVGNVVGQSELLVALLIIATVVHYLRLRERGPIGPAGATSLALLYAVACLVKEHGILLIAFLGLAELLVVADARPWRARARALAPTFVALALVAAGFMRLRASIPGVVAGERYTALLANFPYGTRLLTMLAIVHDWGRLLLWPSHLSADYSPQQLEIVERFTVTLLPELLLAGGVLALFVLLWRRHRPAAFALGWTLVSLAIVSNLLVPTGVLLAERTLFTASIGAMLLVGAALAAVEPLLRGAPARTRVLAAGALGLLIAAGAVRSAVRQPVWRDNATLFPQTVKDAPFAYKARWMYGGWLFEQGKYREGEQQIRLATRLFDRDATLYEDFAQRYVRGGMCAPAIPLFMQAVYMEPARTESRLGLAACLLKIGRFDEARAVAQKGVVRGVERRRFENLVAMAARRDSADAIRP